MLLLNKIAMDYANLKNKTIFYFCTYENMLIKLLLLKKVENNKKQIHIPYTNNSYFCKNKIKYEKACSFY